MEQQNRISSEQDTALNGMICDAIRKIAHKGIVNGNTQLAKGTERIFGYVVKVHDDSNDALYGTVDVREFVDPSERGNESVGLHKGVYLSALQNNFNGYVVIPKLYSEVVIVQDSFSLREYVIMCSHVDVVQIDAHEKASIGVKEREPYDENDEDGPDINELAETGVYSNTTYLKNSIVSEVQEDNGQVSSQQTIDGSGISQKAVNGSKSSELSVTKDELQLEHGTGKIAIDDNQVLVKKGGESVVVENDAVYIGSKGNSDYAVLGVELASLLSDFLRLLGSTVVTTSLGPQPLSTVPSFIQMLAKVNAYKASHSGFITQKVKIQK